jgi:hypothetical protein
MRAGIWVDDVLAYDTPLIVNVSAPLEATLSMVPAVTRQTLAAPFRTVGKLIGFGLAQVALDLGAAIAVWALPRARASPTMVPARYCQDVLTVRAVFIESTF